MKGSKKAAERRKETEEDCKETEEEDHMVVRRKETGSLGKVGNILLQERQQARRQVHPKHLIKPLKEHLFQLSSK